MTTPLEQKALNNLLKGLQSLDCSYVVIDKDGADYSYGEAFQKGRKRKKSKHPFGTLRNHYWPWIEKLEPGKAVEIPGGPFELVDIQSGVGAKASTIWGPGSFITTMNKDKNVLEVLRVF